MTKQILGLVMMFAICGTLALTLPVLAEDTSIVIPGKDTEIVQTDIPAYSAEAAKKILPNILAWVFGIFITLTALMIIISGLMFVTGGGNPDQIAKAKNMLVMALIGLAVALTAQGIMKLLESLLKGTA